MVAHWIRNRAVRGSNPIVLRDSCEHGIYNNCYRSTTRVDKNEELQLGDAATTDTFPWFISPEPLGNSLRSWCQNEGHRDRSAINPMDPE